MSTPGASSAWGTWTWGDLGNLGKLVDLGNLVDLGTEPGGVECEAPADACTDMHLIGGGSLDHFARRWRAISYQPGELVSPRRNALSVAAPAIRATSALRRIRLIRLISRAHVVIGGAGGGTFHRRQARNVSRTSKIAAIIAALDSLRARCRTSRGP